MAEYRYRRSKRQPHTPVLDAFLRTLYAGDEGAAVRVWSEKVIVIEVTSLARVLYSLEGRVDKVHPANGPTARVKALRRWFPKLQLRHESVVEQTTREYHVMPHARVAQMKHAAARLGLVFVSRY